jgi:N-acetyl-anhydromuramyl-L-alanine amidase AmpD
MKLLFENWRRFLTEKEESEYSFADPSTDPTVLEPEVEGYSVETILKDLAAEKLKDIKASPNKGSGTVVRCYGGDCIDQMIANEHAPLWNLHDLRRMFKKKYPALVKQLKNVIKVDEPGMFGAYGQGQSRPMLGGVSNRAGDPKYIVIHSSTTKNPFRTVAALQARKPGRRGLSKMEEARKSEHGGLSTNYEIYFDGTIYEYFPPEMATSHAGGEHNSESIGIDLTGKPQDHTSEQISALQGLIDDLTARYNIPRNVAPYEMRFKDAIEVVRSAYGIVSHRSINPGARQDPGKTVMNSVGSSKETDVAMAADIKKQKSARIQKIRSMKRGKRLAMKKK